MGRYIILKIGLFCLILMSLGSAQMIMYIDPPRIPAKVVGQQCTVTVRLRNAYLIPAWQAGLYFNSTTLSGNSVSFTNADSFLRYAYGVSHSVFNVSQSPPFGTGIMYYCGGVQLGTDSGGIGDGNVMKVIFNIVGTGSSILDLPQDNGDAQSMLVDTAVKAVPFICQDGFYGNETVTPTSSFAINTAAGHQTRPDIAWNSTNNEFLVVWEDYTTPGNTQASYIYGQRVLPSGSLSGPVISIQVSALYPAYSPCVSWNGTNYLVAYTRSYVGNQNNFDIYGKTVSATGTVGSEIAICTAVRYQGNPAIAWNGTYHLVVWEDARNSGQLPRIYGQRLNASGALQGTNFYISPNDGLYHQFPRVASNGSEFLVIWVDNNSNNGGGRIQGQRVASDGSLLGSVITIASGNASCADVAWDGTNYLVVYQRATSTINWDIYGQRVSSTGSLVGSAFAINTASGDQTCPRVVYDSQAGRYAVLWVSEQNYPANSPAIYKQIVNTDGTLYLGPTLFADANYQQLYPAVANGSTNDMAVWADLRGGSNFDIYGYNPTSIGIEEEDVQNQEIENPELEVYPNPFRNAVSIKFQLPNPQKERLAISGQRSAVSLKIYDATGRLVRCLALDAKRLTPVVWDGTDDFGRRLPGGIYFLKIESPSKKEFFKLIKVK